MRWLGIVLMFLGAVIGGAGGYASAVAVQPGDWLVGRTETLNPNHERVVVAAYGSTSYASGLRIVATTTDGHAVFIGSANPIDVDDYTAGVARVEITSMAPLRRMETSARQGSKNPPAEPVGLDFWIDHQYGQGAQSLSLTDSRTPDQVMVVGAADEAISVRVDHLVPGLRKVVLGTIGAGALIALIGAGLVVGSFFRRRNRPQPTPDPADGPTPPLPAPPPPTAPLTRWVSVVLAASLVATTAGCTVPRVPARVDVLSRAAITKVPLPDEAVGRVTSSLEQRMGQARRASSPPTYSAESWPLVYSELALTSRTFETALAKATASTAPKSACGLVVAQVYGDRQAAYPMTTTALLKWSCTSELELYYSTLTRAHSYSPWLIASEVAATKHDPPKSSQEAVTDDEKREGAQLAATLVNETTGDGGSLTSYVKQMVDSLNPKSDEMNVTFAFAPPDPGANPSATTVAKTQTGTIVTFSCILTATLTARPGYLVYWPPPLDQLLNQTGKHASISRRFLGSFSVMYEGRIPTVLGISARPIA